MPTIDLGKYFDERGTAVLANERRLRELGLNVKRTPAGSIQTVGPGAVLGLFDLDFERQDEKFSAELVEFLNN
jgi:hypothetical protein